MNNEKSPAFPVASSSWGNHGLTKREYFAAMAMQGILAHDGAAPMRMLSELCVQYADALLAELSK